MYIPIDQSPYVQLFGFSNASQKEFAVIVYISFEYSLKLSTVHLITAKSKVASLKSGNIDKSLSIPKLKLYGSFLLSQIIYIVLKYILIKYIV